MGGSFYSSSSRSLRAATKGYHTKSVADTFIQQKERKAHESMMSQNVTIREARDSEAHPNSTPIILGLDVTGSMARIPAELIKDGLPTLMGNLIQKGVPDAALCFIAIGDHTCDRHPLQIAQFESGDAELDMWLTRTYLEGGGGGNTGESYLLAWYFAAFHTAIDSFEKRGKKGFLITIGDEPNLHSLSLNAIKENMPNTPAQTNFTADELLEKAQEKYHVFHIHINHSSSWRNSGVENSWKEKLKDHCIVIDDHKDVANTIVDIVLNTLKDELNNTSINVGKTIEKPEDSKKEESTIPIKDILL